MTTLGLYTASCNILLHGRIVYNKRDVYWSDPARFYGKIDVFLLFFFFIRELFANKRTVFLFFFFFYSPPPVQKNRVG